MEISNLLKNYERDLKVKNYAQNSILNYLSQIKLFLTYFKNKDSAKHISSDEIKDYLLTAKEVNSQRHMHSAIKLFYKYTVIQPQKFSHIEYARKEKKLPKIIDKNFLLDKISLIDNVKHRAVISIAFSVGLRVSEVCNLKVIDIDSKRMLISVNQAKGKKDRLAPLSENILELLRKYFLIYKPKDYLFEGEKGGKYSERSCQQIVKKYLGKDYHFHLLRHSSFTSMLESGVDLRLIQKVAGHQSIKTTTTYTHVSTQFLNQIATPI